MERVKYEHKGLKVEGEVGFIRSFAQICRESDRANERWVNNLISEGYDAAHPNDGWVDRENNNFILQYPQFNRGVKVGSKVMLGWHFDTKTHRPVEVVEIKTRGLTRYYFKDIKQPKNQESLLAKALKTINNALTITQQTK
jgi:hypothetical protein